MIKKIGYLLAIVIMVSILANLAKSLPRLFSSSRKIDETRTKVQELEKENEILKAELESRKSQEFVEREAREKLGFVKEGESLLVLPKEEEKVEEPKRVEKPNWQKWKDVLFGS